MRILAALPILVSLAVLGPLHAAKVYRWTDEQGQVHFSDEPRPGSEPVEVDEPPTYRSQPAPDIPQPQRNEQQQSQGYSELAITSPAPEATIRGPSQSLSVSVSLSPGLRPDHRLQLRYDGEVVSSGRRSQFTVSPVYRGAHQLQAVVVDGSGNTVKQSETVTFYKHQPSVN